MTSDLIPPDDILAECAMTRETFMSSASAFLHALLIARARLKPHESVLDLGSGNAHKAAPLTAYLDEHGRYEGHDIVEKWFAWSQRAYAAYPNFSFTLADDLYSSHYNPNGPIKAEDYTLPYGDAQFDVVICSSLFTHMLPDETANYLRQVGRVLKPRGRLVMTAFLLTDETLPKLTSGPIQFHHDAGDCRLRSANNPADAVAIPESRIRSDIGEAGLRICDISYGYWASLPELNGYLQDMIIAIKLAETM